MKTTPYFALWAALLWAASCSGDKELNVLQLNGGLR
jgi:hypothetical protein